MRVNGWMIAVALILIIMIVPVFRWLAIILIISIVAYVVLGDWYGTINKNNKKHK